MKVVYVEPNKIAEIREIGSGLEAMQAAVDGYIEALYPFADPVAIVCNEEGKINGLELNRGLADNKGDLYEVIAGTFFICLAKSDSEDFESLTDELASKYLEIFKYPEVFMMSNGKLISIKWDNEE
ncbi:DUF3846 domain-containing protein [Brassicibacter mesophilus]|uniref:DUF3846 domain-containing protein n=1 Tax=Brassicibacter mesophilus TaxID=745119 RepID=UPI003D22F3D7